jgi:hypothetical protein
MKNDVLTVSEQRQQNSHKLMIAGMLELKLTDLMRDILAGDVAKLVEFQQFIQYAPEPTRERLLAQLEAKRFSQD